MKRLSVFFILSFTLLCFQSNCQKQAVDIEAVIDSFYNKYSTFSTELYPVPLFEKKDYDWYISFKNQEGKPLPNLHQLFYDAKLGRFKKLKGVRLKYSKTGDDAFDLVTKLKKQMNELNNDNDNDNFKTFDDIADSSYKRYVDEFTKRSFRLHSFYGYNGWYKDVISTLSKKIDLNDDEINSLAKAYSVYASSLLINSDGFADTREIFKLKLKANCLSSIQLKKYDSIANLSCKTYLRLLNQNSNYETFVGNIAIKYANEITGKLHTYLVYANSNYRNVQLPDNLYPQDFIDSIKNMLLACPINSIFLSFGDNDFYPLLYLQHKYNIRQDVYVINWSLLGVDRFILSNSTQRQFDANEIKLKADTNSYKKEKNDYISIKGHSNDEDVMMFNEFYRRLKFYISDGVSYATISSNKFGFTNSKKEIFSIQFSEKYILKNEFILMDIINNLGNRKICCKKGSCGEGFMLSNYCNSDYMYTSTIDFD